MGTTKVKVIDLSKDTPEVKTSRKAAQKIRPSINTEEKPITESAQKKEGTEQHNASASSKNSVPPVIKKRSSIETEEKTIPQGTEKMGAKQRAKAAATAEPTPAKARPHGAKYKKASEEVEKGKVYPVKDALELLGKTSFTKFDPAVEIHINVTQKNTRGAINFPHPIGPPKKEKKYLVFSDKLKTTAAKNVIIATDATIDELISGRLKPGRDFNAVLASAKFMPQLARVAKVLGPAGMMPNPKSGTITEEPEKIFAGAILAGAYEFRNDPQAPIVHLKLGKLSDKSQELEENLKAALTTIGVNKIKKAVIKTTMSPGIKLDVTSI